MRLQGYAVELAVKNMEYKAVDDTKVDAQGQAVEDGEDAGEVGGFDFGVLIKRKPEIKDALLGFRDSLQTELSKGEEIKVVTQ
jgi:UDP-glucose:glycoprotein glucosyltransferase